MLDPDFASMLEGLSVDALEREPTTIVGAWADGRIGYFNPAYREFAEAAGAMNLCARWGLGANVLDAIGQPLHAFHIALIERTLATLTPSTHEYECPTPSHAQTYSVRLEPLAAGKAVLMTHSRLVSRPHTHAVPGVVDDYRGEGGLVVQCAHCRRVRRKEAPHQWDLVTAYIAEPPTRTSHGLCSLCFEYHYGAMEFD